MSILSLHPNQLQILRALQSAMRILRTREYLTIVGSLGKFLAGATQRVGDVDVRIERPLCERYWEFLEILSLHGVRSVFDVLDRPSFPWTFCCPLIAHARALTVDCAALNLSYANLDICFTPSDLAAIQNPDSTRWVDKLDPNWRQWDTAQMDEEVRLGHERLIAELTQKESVVSNRKCHPELELYFVS
jgi:hypothetical protein